MTALSPIPHLHSKQEEGKRENIIWQLNLPSLKKVLHTVTSKYISWPGLYHTRILATREAVKHS